MIGKVYIIGAGPGDEGLLTVKGLQCLKLADVVIYDYLVNPVMLENSPQDCLKVYAGKKAGDHTMKQDLINEEIVKHALEGKTVVRLKGGDPFIFGRGGEEALALVQNNIPFEIIPGITSGIAAAAYAGIPATHRDCGSTLTLITGHESADKPQTDIDWEALARLKGTLIFYMGVKNIGNISSRLIGFGKAPETPVALIRLGTTYQQETIVGNLSDIEAKATEANFQPPALILVGEVVNYREQLQWFEKMPLFGKRILVTRSRTQASNLSKQLRELGADVVELPTIDIIPVKDLSNLDASIQQISRYDWLIFTSTNGVGIFMDHLLSNGKDGRSIAGCKIAVVGEETASELKKYGLLPDLKPLKFTTDSLIDAFSEIGELKSSKILMPTSEIANTKLPEFLKSQGAEVEVIGVYQNVLPTYDKKYISILFSKSFDAVTFTSSSTVSNLVKLMKEHQLEQQLADLKGISIGPMTSSTARQLGVTIEKEADPHTIKGLIAGLLDYLHIRQDKL